jgi:hypothetical protein
VKAIRAILGSFCLLIALFLLIVVLIDFKFRADLLLALAGCWLAGIGLFLVFWRNLPMSKNGRIFFLLNSGLIVGCLFFGIPRFIKAHSTSCCNSCINNLRQIDGAINEWAVEQGKANGTMVTDNDIKPYIKLDAQGNIPKCPDGGIYTYGKVGDRYQVTCSLSTNAEQPHVLP